MSARALLIQVIEFLDLRVKDPDRWPALEALLEKALTEDRQAIWDQIHVKCAEEVAHWNPEGHDLPRQQARAQEAAEIDAWAKQMEKR